MAEVKMDSNICSLAFNRNVCFFVLWRLHYFCFRCSKFNIWPWEFKVKVMAKTDYNLIYRLGPSILPKMKEMTKIITFCDAVTLTSDHPWPQKVNQLEALSLLMCVPHLRTIHPRLFKLSCSHNYIWQVVDDRQLWHEDIISPNPSNTADKIYVTQYCLQYHNEECR